MKYHENHQKRALGVIVAVSSQNWCFLKGLVPTSKSMALAHLDPCVWVCGLWSKRSWGVLCVCGRRIENIQGKGFEAKRIVPALPGIAPASSRHPPDIGYLSVYMYVYIFICVLVCVRVYVCVCASRALVTGGSVGERLPLLVRDTIDRGSSRRW